MTKQYKYTIRRHLGRGKNLGDFIVRGYKTDSKQGEFIEYINPENFNLILTGCKFYIRKATTQKIFDGANKEVCGWIICEDYKTEPSKIVKGAELKFNPRKGVNFTADGETVNDAKPQEIRTYKTNLFITK
jgi:hypothetical protein